MAENTCEHLESIPARDLHEVAGCEECIPLGWEWVELRACLTCGHVGCCDSSRGTHATAHHKETSHPVMQTAQPGDDWRWCYLDEVTG